MTLTLRVSVDPTIVADCPFSRLVSRNSFLVARFPHRRSLVNSGLNDETAAPCGQPFRIFRYAACFFVVFAAIAPIRTVALTLSLAANSCLTLRAIASVSRMVRKLDLPELALFLSPSRARDNGH